MPRNLFASRHPAVSKVSRRAAITIGGMLASSAAIAGAGIVAIMAAGGTYAMWNTSAKLDAGTIESGSVGLTVNGLSSYALDGTAWSHLLPGDVVSQEVTVTNTGTVAGTVTASTSGSVGPLVVHVAKGACGAPLGGPGSTVSPSDLGVFSAGEASVVCLQVTMPADAANTAQGSSQAFSVAFTSTTGS